MVLLKEAILEIVDDVRHEIETCALMRENRSPYCQDCEYEKICDKVRARYKSNEVAELQGY